MYVECILHFSYILLVTFPTFYQINHVSGLRLAVALTPLIGFNAQVDTLYSGDDGTISLVSSYIMEGAICPNQNISKSGRMTIRNKGGPRSGLCQTVRDIEDKEMSTKNAFKMREMWMIGFHQRKLIQRLICCSIGFNKSYLSKPVACTLYITHIVSPCQSTRNPISSSIL